MMGKSYRVQITEVGRSAASFGVVQCEAILDVSKKQLKQLKHSKISFIILEEANVNEFGERLNIDIKNKPRYDIKDKNSSKEEKDEETFECGELKNDGNPCTRPVKGPDVTCFQH